MATFLKKKSRLGKIAEQGSKLGAESENSLPHKQKMNIGPKGDQTPGAGKLPWKDYSITKGRNEEGMVTFLDKHASDWEMEMLLGKEDVLVSREPLFRRFC